MDYDEIINLECLVLQHEQADIAAHTFCLAAGGIAFYGFDLHGDTETHGALPPFAAGDGPAVFVSAYLNMV